MQDLLLWHHLRQPVLPPASTLLPLLEELAQEALNHRLPFFSLYERSASHPDAAVRAAAVRALAGAYGFPALRSLVAALKDPTQAVRLAAVDSLKVSASADPAQWVHALYHSDAAVRARAEEIGAPAGFSALFEEPNTFEGWQAQAVLPTAMSYGSVVPPDVHDELQGALADPARNAAGLERFLERGTGDDSGLRAQAASHLLDQGKGETVFPVLLACFGPRLTQVNSELCHLAARGVVMAGNFDFERYLTDVLYNRAWTDPDQKALTELLTEATDINTRYWARDRVKGTFEQSMKLSRLARVFAWGIEIGKLLTGERFTIEMLLNEYDLGYTRLRENKIHITPLPILRRERNGAEIVRGLIVHEYGHHMFHKGAAAEAVWQQADDEGLGKLLNLVTDEHLERKLRQHSRRFGELLKYLNAYAFQYNRRALAVRSLLRYLGHHAKDLLPRLHLGVAQKYGCVVVQSGRFLREMEVHGHSFARFVRALRMGLGNRTNDPRVAEALALFKGSFRKSTMPQLLEVARRLREIFGDETNILNDFSMESAMGGDELEWLANGAGIDPESLRQKVDDLMKPDATPLPGGAGDGSGPSVSWGLNLRPEELFKQITTVVKLNQNPAVHAEYARRVARPAKQLRRYFQDLGIGLKKDQGRLQGHHLDRSRIRALVLKGDPRLLVARKMQRVTDLFLGVAIDCSGSMAGAKLEQARLFGMLLAEALQGQHGVDLRLFGFTDRVLYDAGDARRSAVESLASSDGNNDAAALWHIYRLARASRRKAKLLVMISDGLPTECSVEALKALVLRLSRWGYCAAQVAVQPLEHICFPHYVLLQEQEFDVAVRKFGEVVIRLVGQALGKP